MMAASNLIRVLTLINNSIYKRGIKLRCLCSAGEASRNLPITSCVPLYTFLGKLEDFGDLFCYVLARDIVERGGKMYRMIGANAAVSRISQNFHLTENVSNF